MSKIFNIVSSEIETTHKFEHILTIPLEIHSKFEEQK